MRQLQSPIKITEQQASEGCCGDFKKLKKKVGMKKEEESSTSATTD